MQAQFNYKLSFNAYRKMLYFNTFYRKLGQNIFILLVWVAAATCLILDILHLIYPSRAMHLSFLVVTVSVPMFVVSLEMKLHQMKNADFFGQDRTVIFTDEGIDYYLDDKKKKNHDPWDDVMLLCETRNLFIVYKDDKHSLPVLKKGIPKEEIQSLRQDLKNKLGIRYKVAII
jgi:hypothetical protein